MHPIAWRVATVAEIIPETPRVRTLALDVSGWPGHRAGQHVDVRLTSDDGYQTERSYSIASPPEEARIELTIERLEDGEVSSYLVDVLGVGDPLELRGPIGGHFVWSVSDGGPLMLVGGGSGIVPLMAMLRHRATASEEVRRKAPARLLYSSRSWNEVIYRDELARLAAADDFARGRAYDHARAPAWLDGIPQAHRRGDARRDRVARCVEPASLRVRAHAARRGGGGGARRARPRPGVGAHGALRPNRAYCVSSIKSRVSVKE